MTTALLTELYRQDSLQIIDATKAAHERFAGPIERSRAQTLGSQLDADAVLFGTVLEFHYVPGAPRNSGTIPSISVNVRLVSTQSGAILWAAGTVGNSLQLFTFDSMPIEELAQSISTELIADLADSLPAGTYVARKPPTERAPPRGEAHPAVVEEKAATPNDNAGQEAAAAILGPETTSATESQPESGTGAEPPPESETSAEPQPATETSAEPKSETETGAEPQSESGTGAEPQPESETGAEPQSETETGAEPQPESGTGAEPQPESGTGAEPQPESGTGAEPKSVPAPQPSTPEQTTP